MRTVRCIARDFEKLKYMIKATIETGSPKMQRKTMNTIGTAIQEASESTPE